MDKLGTKELEIFYKKKNKIKENPQRQKHLSGGENCYREPITENIRLIYWIKGKTVWLLTLSVGELMDELVKRGIKPTITKEDLVGSLETALKTVK